ncbi:CPBP family intramembrane metalloprotease [Luteolibacter yonseiensis]|uniref:CPBP family intramembrane metalloprotease n=1 Tax=Luteolibacter yonseiensis TaxID=1144680 RepID=A0A934R530_9BACT|nr:type II CAAX endopeptidase family protein [Luteolibacter yonseiensis]MBK1815410.1 CPBP family intramembrane metalloprotease [Luteolibacter yonseiensis]
MRRVYPEPFVALLAFVLGIWLWDLYFGKNAGYPPGTEEMALVKIDRDLRLADAMADDAAWQRALVGVELPWVTKRKALEAMEKLAREGGLSPQGREAFVMLKALEDGKMPEGIRTSSEIRETAERLALHQGTWWEAKWLESLEPEDSPGMDWGPAYKEDMDRLKTRAVATGAMVSLLGLVGLAFIPSALGCLKEGFFPRFRGYGEAWSLPLGLVVFMLATLAWIGFSMTLDLAAGVFPGMHPLAGIALDSLARVLPAVIVLGLLFRRPSHGIRVLGLVPPVAWRPIFGMFTLLMIFDHLLRVAMGNVDPNEPGGGLSRGEAGGWGLVYALVSACVLAPVVEEIVYRGLLFRSFRNRLGVLPAALLSSAVFAVLHIYDGYGLISVGVFGFSCALLYSGTASLTTVIVLHLLYNLSIKLPEWVFYHAPLG